MATEEHSKITEIGIKRLDDIGFPVESEAIRDELLALRKQLAAAEARAVEAEAEATYWSQEVAKLTNVMPSMGMTVTCLPTTPTAPAPAILQSQADAVLMPAPVDPFEAAARSTIAHWIKIGHQYWNKANNEPTSIWSPSYIKHPAYPSHYISLADPRAVEEVAQWLREQKKKESK